MRIETVVEKAKETAVFRRRSKFLVFGSEELQEKVLTKPEFFVLQSRTRTIGRIVPQCYR